MRNLHLSNHREYRVPGLSISSDKNYLNLLVVDNLKNACFVESAGVVYRFYPEDEKLITVFDVNDDEQNVSKTIVGMCYFQVTDTLCLAIDKGDLLSINCSSLEERECVGFVESGITLMETSPDEDILVLLTAENTIITMTASFDPINETDLLQKEFGENQFITVGWGRKETQFHGSEGKAAALAKPSHSSILLPNYDRGLSKISWRGDGAFFAVNCLNQETEERYVRVFDRKGDLMYTSEHIPGLEGAISWRPSGNIIACTQRMPNKNRHVVCFLEKNGLRHGDFTLPFALDVVCIRQLLWNAESTILLVWCQVLESVSQTAGLVAGQSILLLWSVNNYHWYLKQRLDLQIDDSPAAISWDPDSGNRLHIICESGKYINYDFSWRVDHSNGLSCQNGAFVTVIDGDSLLVTSFQRCVIPPPMCGTSLKLVAPALEVVFAPQNAQSTNTKEVESRYLNTSSPEDSGFGDVLESLGSNPNNFFVLLSNGLFAAFSYVGSVFPSNPSHVLVGTYSLDWEGKVPCISYHYLHHWTWISRDSLVCSATEGNSSLMCVFDMDTSVSTEQGRLVHRQTIPLPGTVISIVSGAQGNTALIQLIEGKVLSFSQESGLLSELFTFPHPVLKMIACQIHIDVKNKQDVVLGLSSHSRLYLNSDLIMSNVTSIELHSQFLLFTTSQQQLFCCPLQKSSLLSLSKASGGNPICGVVERKVERGSRLVVVVPYGNRVILQMPRGNLECIEPRALSVSQMTNMLDSQSYYEAFDLARKQRINLNLFVDHNPDLFLKNMGDFIRRVSNPQWLCLFLAELQEEDCTASMYKSHYPESRQCQLPDKVNTVCSAFLTAVKSLDEKEVAKLTLPSLTALVLKNSSDGLEAALALVKSLKESDENSVIKVPWTSALRHLLYLRDVNQLMDAALGMYDFNLVVLVASKSQKDPKEYLAFLNKLRQMEPNYQRYSIDIHLRKWVSALNNLIRSPGDHKDELLKLVVNQDLYKEALQVLPRRDEGFKMVASAYADKLLSQGSYKEAAIMYRRAADFHNALLTHQKARDWKNCMQDAESAGLSDGECKELLSELVSDLKDARHFSDAATILHSYLGQASDAVQVLCLGHHWTEAQQIAKLHGLKDTVESMIRPCAIEYAENLNSQIMTALNQFHSQLDRLVEVRRERQLARERQEMLDGNSDAFGESDLLSDTTSTTGSSYSSKGSSSASSGSNRSSKNRRKQERRVLSLKKGSPHEELALMYALHQNISSTFTLREEALSLNSTLVNYEEDALAADIQNLLSQTLKLMESNFSNIWPPSLMAGCSSNNAMVFGPNVTSNILASNMNSIRTNVVHQPDLSLLESTYRFPPVIRSIKWEFDMLKRTKK